MQEDILKKPILIIGAARSGTTLLNRILRAHPEISCLAEPSFVWRRGRARLRHEMYPASAATPKVVAQIRERFRAVALAKGGARILEKTPANSLRLGFVLTVFPDARIVHIVRDGRDAAVSVRKKLEGDPEFISRYELSRDVRPRGSLAVLSHRLRIGWRAVQEKMRDDPPGLDLVFWMPQIVDQALARVGLRERSVWGPRIPGLRDLLRTHSTLEVAALQWRLSVEQVLNYLAAHPEQPHFLVRFEDLTRDPCGTIKKVMNFVELDTHPQVETALGQVIRSERRSYEEELGAEERLRLHELIADTMSRLGYQA
jgi:hypothetical protein